MVKDAAWIDGDALSASNLNRAKVASNTNGAIELVWKDASERALRSEERRVGKECTG